MEAHGGRIRAASDGPGGRHDDHLHPPAADPVEQGAGRSRRADPAARLLLPGRDGLKLFEEIPELPDLPVIFISGYGREETIARAFELGAADYVVKPFSATELVARVRAPLCRHSDPEPFVLGELAIHYETRAVTVAGTAVDVTPTEFELLRMLSVNAPRVVHFDTLLRRVWAHRDGADANAPAWIFNQRGVATAWRKPGG